MRSQVTAGGERLGGAWIPPRLSSATADLRGDLADRDLGRRRAAPSAAGSAIASLLIAHAEPARRRRAPAAADRCGAGRGAARRARGTLVVLADCEFAGVERRLRPGGAATASRGPASSSSTSMSRRRPQLAFIGQRRPGRAQRPAHRRRRGRCSAAGELIAQQGRPHPRRGAARRSSRRTTRPRRPRCETVQQPPVADRRRVRRAPGPGRRCCRCCSTTTTPTAMSWWSTALDRHRRGRSGGSTSSTSGQQIQLTLAPGCDGLPQLRLHHHATVAAARRARRSR